MMTTEHTDLGPPRWVLAWLVVVGLIVVAACVFVAFRAQSAADLAKDNTRILNANQMVSARADCRAVIGAARRDVLDQLNLRLDVDRTLHDELLGDALLGSVTGTRPTQDDIDAYNTNHEDLKADRVLAATLVPHLPTVDDVAEHGGTMPVLHADRSVTDQRFDPCPKVG